jgi:hypothetical protein
VHPDTISVTVFGGNVDTGAGFSPANVDPAIATSGVEVAVIAAKVEALALDRSAVCCNPAVP